MLVQAAVLLCALAQQSQGATFAIPSTVRNSGLPYAKLNSAPIGFSFEFFAFPSYFTNVTATTQCLSNWKDLTGVWPPIRVGGTTQDRATFDPNSQAYVTYSVANPADAPKNLTFGPALVDLAAKYGGSVVMGLNRGRNDLQNTIAAAKTVAERMGGDRGNLQAIELGNEPEYYPRDPQPIAQGGWDEKIDAQSQDQWAGAVGSAIGRKDIIQAGNSNDAPPKWGAATLFATGNKTAQQYMQRYAHHNYPGGSVADLMNHTRTVRNIRGFEADVAAAHAIEKQYVFGETNSVSGGGAAGVSPTFGAALWTMDYSLRALSSNISNVYFHQGTVGNCQYCQFGRYTMGAPYYGATAATAFLSTGDSIAALDDGESAFAAYASFDKNGKPLRVLLYNSNYYTTGDRPSEDFTLTGLADGTIRAKRLTAASAMIRADQSSQLSFGGQTWANVTCVAQGEETFESANVSGGQVTLKVGATEALVVYLS
ncbi:hypothetical protein PpBr36_01486 [Pyricularia pennisetigena]|uniref:hypothetical protein n=1 Tax=Pyricularia pennisetigena TaxID=1578925 RepID=UPI00114E3615|nr:hypothetical protein PpBr36_01486 [Pyricularia pennisetigena]TLS27910.1 hypothetical protein PpBr36_01486 [Pyricularia pennisetigena]